MNAIEKVREEIWNINNLVSYANTPTMGLGVIARDDIQAGSEILCDPVRTFSKDEAEKLRSSEAYYLTFVDRETYGKGVKFSPVHLVVGPISMINHNRHPNCEVTWDIGRGVLNPKARLHAKRDILEGEQLFIAYHNIDEYDFE